MWYIGSTTDLAPLPPSQGLSPLTEDALFVRGLSPGSASLSLPAATPPGRAGEGGSGAGAPASYLAPVAPLCGLGLSAPWRQKPRQVQGPPPGMPGPGRAREASVQPVRMLPAEGAGQPQARVRERPAALEAGTAPGGFVCVTSLTGRQGCDGRQWAQGETEAQKADVGCPGKLQVAAFRFQS